VAKEGVDHVQLGVAAPSDFILPPVAASTMRRMTVIKAKTKIALESTLRVGNLRIRGAIKIEPTP
jgi:hypothetical protein